MQNINRVVLTGNLTRDPELRATGPGVSVCSLRLAVNSRVKKGDEWVDKANYFDVTVFGAHGENCARYLAKGRPVAIDGRLEWREWTDRDSGQRRQAVGIIADSVQFLSSRDDDANTARGFGDPRQGDPGAADFRTAPAPAAPVDDDIPFRSRHAGHDEGRVHNFNDFGGLSCG